MNTKNSLYLCLLLAISPFITNAQTENIALNKQVKVSSVDGKNIASKTVDGIKSSTNYWQTETQSKAPHFIEIDLHKYHKISNVSVYSLPGDAEKLTKQIVVQYWDDSNWTPINVKPLIDKNKTVITYPISPALVTFMVRIEALNAPSIAISEIEVAGSLVTGQAPETVLKLKTGEPKDATVTVTNENVGKSFKYVGYNQGYYMPGSNVSAWLAYSQVNSLRVWTSLTEYAPTKDFNEKNEVNTLADFEALKSRLRSSPEKNEFINWNALLHRYEVEVDKSGNQMNFGYALSELKKLKIQPVLQINERRFVDTWKDKWEHWQRYYALAYYAAKKGNTAMFAMQNEPNHKESGPMKIPTWMLGLQIASDAVKCAVADVNKKYHTNLNPKFVAPITAGYNTDWWAYVVNHIRDGYDGKKMDRDLFDIFSTHSYNQPASGYATRTSDIREIIKENHPLHDTLPIVYTEIGRWMNSLLIDKKETYDSPSVFTEWAGIYANNLKNQTYGMWAFKFANTVSSTYTKGIKSGHHLTWQGQRIIEDAYKNLALNAKVSSTNGNSNELKFVTDGNKSDASTWKSDSTANAKTVEIDLGKQQSIGSISIYSGSSYGVYTGPDRIKNFEIQYFSDKQWKTLPDGKVKDSKYVRYFISLKNPVNASKIRFISSDAGIIKLREIKVFAESDKNFKADDYNVSGLHRTAEVVRLFATGFKGERPLLKTTSNTDATKFDHYTSYDEKKGNYYMWLVQRDGFDYNLKINLADLNIGEGNPVIAQTVSPDLYGEASQVKSVSANKEVEITLPAQGVVLLTIPAGKGFVKQVTNVTNDATVSAGANSLKNYGNDKSLQVALNAAEPAKNKVAYLAFNLKTDAKNAAQIILSVNGKTTTDTTFRIHVYAIPSQTFDENNITWATAPQLDKTEALVTQVATKAFIAGELSFDGTAKTHYLDVTEVIKKHPSENYTFVLVRETRHAGDDEDKNRTINIASKEDNNGAQLIYWTNK
nr:discoidin domain-containing protein [uncultured Pedobacter sp.]